VDEHDHEEIVDIGRPQGNEPAGKLIVTIGGEERDYPIVSNVMTIGRGHASDIRIASHFVSRLHAKVRTDEGATIIEDAGSKNGVLVNSQRVRRRVLHHGDIVSLGGDFNLRFVDSMR
jgi:pSer/pThr/pTyr-binding forkhead associated (FHA) protein